MNGAPKTNCESPPTVRAAIAFGLYPRTFQRVAATANRCAVLDEPPIESPLRTPETRSPDRFSRPAYSKHAPPAPLLNRRDSTSLVGNTRQVPPAHRSPDRGGRPANE